MKERFENVKEFANYVAEHLFDDEPEMAMHHEVEVKDIVKNNGTVRTGLIIKADSCNVAPTIYLNDGYERYLEGENIDSIIESVLSIYDESRLNSDFSAEFFTDFEQVKERLTLKLINADSNEEMLKECPHLIIGDLAIIFQVRVDITSCGNATITVRKEHANMWNVGTASLLTSAKLNMERKEKFRIQSMLEVLAGMMGITEEEALVLGNDMPMFVMSNESRVNGACGLIFTENLQNFAEKHDCNLIILPSSIHELILLLDDGKMDAETLIDMVKAVNESEVSPDEVLSDSVYYYDKDTHELSNFKSGEIMEIKMV